MGDRGEWAASPTTYPCGTVDTPHTACSCGLNTNDTRKAKKNITNGGGVNSADKTDPDRAKTDHVALHNISYTVPHALYKCIQCRVKSL